MKIILNRKWFSPMIKICLFAFLILIVLITMLLGYRFTVQQQIKQKSAAIIENGGISELKEINVKGDKQYILVAGKDKEKSFYLFLHGWPGPNCLSARTLQPEITENCVGVYYDQIDSGKSFNKKLTIAHFFFLSIGHPNFLIC